jgi:hypothetical protein
MAEVSGGLGRRLRLGVIGGGPGSFIGPVHRLAARFDDRYEVVASVLSSDPERSREAGLLPDAKRASRTVLGHPEGYQEAFATLYTEFADLVAARRLVRPLADPPPVPIVRDGARGIAFIAAAKQSSAANGAWTPVPSVD